MLISFDYVLVSLLTTQDLLNGCHFAGDIIKFIFLNRKCSIVIQISLKFVRKGRIDNKVIIR